MDHDERRGRPAGEGAAPREPSRSERPEKDGYHRAARFDGRRAEPDAKRAYQQTRRDLHRAAPEVDLSVFRLQIGNLIGGVAYLGWYVALIGARPDEALEARLEQTLAGGSAVALPEEVIAMLRERREQTANLAPWVERHYGRITKVERDRRPEEQGEPGPQRGRR